MKKIVTNEEFKKLNIGCCLDEGMASPNEEFFVYYAERINNSIEIEDIMLHIILNQACMPRWGDGGERFTSLYHLKPLKRYTFKDRYVTIATETRLSAQNDISQEKVFNVRWSRFRVLLEDSIEN